MGFLVLKTWSLESRLFGIEVTGLIGLCQDLGFRLLLSV